MEIASYEFTDEGMCRMHENEKWMVGIKNWKPANDITSLDMLERHNETDELFVLLPGSCALISAEGLEDDWALDKVGMQPGRIYNVLHTLWRSTITQKDTKMILIEDFSTGESNSDSHRLTAEDLKAVRQLVQSK